MSRHVVYRMYSRDGDLLYVGCTASIVRRTVAHRAGSAWFKDVGRIAYEAHPRRDVALGVEASTIKSLMPRHNIQHNPAAPSQSGYRMGPRSVPPVTKALLDGALVGGLEAFLRDARGRRASTHESIAFEVAALTGFRPSQTAVGRWCKDLGIYPYGIPVPRKAKGAA